MPNSFLSNYTYADPGNLTKKKGLARGIGDTFHNIARAEMATDAQRQQEFAPVFGGYSDLANGGTAADNNALEQSVLTPLGGAYDQARQQGAQHLARTRNSAGYGSFLGELARSQGRDYAQAGAGIANEKFNRKMAGLEGIQRLYGIDTSFLASLGQQQQGNLGIGNSVESRRKGILGTIGGALGIAGKIGSGIAGAF